MGLWKEYSEEIRTRGYDDSDKYVCATCVGDKYFYNRIRTIGDKGKCSFCGHKRKVVPMNDVLSAISEIIKRDYLQADGNAIYDSEEHEYLDPVMDPYDFVFGELNQYLESDNEGFLNEILDKLAFEDRMRADLFRTNQEELDVQAWKEYCDLVKTTPLSAEQIVSLIKPENKKNLPDDLEAIQGVLEMVYEYCEELHLVGSLNSASSKNGGTSIYRCVNYLDLNPKFAGLSFIPATLVGTAPARLVADGRMSEQGDMMFYGADDYKTAMIEVGRDSKDDNHPATMGTFYTNKQFRILDLSELSAEVLPSIFDVDNAQKRSVWFFLKEFMNEISKAKEDGDKYFYKPTQVLTKYIQRNTDLKGIRFKSSKTSGKCYVLFVVNRDCLDDGDKTDNSRNQLIMRKVEQEDFTLAGI